ncbi:uncharacterized protein LOC124321043 [Daphnia pulicaria]|uniref:uncharacterized protein LOC124321043 n=1 Tax=Daphnia pulicaria TaxID=35523 RepID=UPI001EEA6E96|nr:uncharacterized protein LOC124321043 [Daphnia pulicaria]
MYFRIISVLLLIFVFTTLAQNIEKNEETSSRLFLSTFTVILSTVTSTTTIGITSTCTTSSSAMAACSVGGRRRRGILFEGENKQARVSRGLFYNEDEEELNDGSLSINQVKRSTDHNENNNPSSTVTVNETDLIPLTIQSGFSLPEGFSPGTHRFKLAYGTSTIITTATSVATRSLIIFCSSITNYPTCSGLPLAG